MRHDRLEVTSLSLWPGLDKLMHGFQLTFNNSIFGILQLGTLIEHDVHTATLFGALHVWPVDGAKFEGAGVQSLGLPAHSQLLHALMSSKCGP